MATSQPHLVIKTRTDGVSPVSPIVLGLAALVSAPAIWAAMVTGDLPLADALVRFLVAWLGCAFGVSLLVAAVGPRQRPERAEAEEDASAAASTADPGASGATSSASGSGSSASGSSGSGAGSGADSSPDSESVSSGVESGGSSQS